MLYAKVVVGLPVEGPFDYIVPADLISRIKIGVRAWVPFRTKSIIGYVVGITSTTKIKNLKKILEVIDEQPVLNKSMLRLSKELAEYYCCSWGEAIETALPEGLRKGKKIVSINVNTHSDKKDNPDVILVQDLDGKERWNIYLREIKDTLNKNKSTIVLLPDLNSVLKAQDKITPSINTPTSILYRKQPKELEEWIKVREGKANIVIGMRSAIFSPVNNLGLVIMDEEQDSVYKQDQVPHYHAREVAFMRTNIEKAKLILGATSCSLESLQLVKANRIKYDFVARNRDFPEIKLVDVKSEQRSRKKRHIILSKYLQGSIYDTLNSSGKVLLFINRRGFATFASCRNCALVLKCPRCNINLVYHFKDNILNCHYCNFKMEAPSICPNCNSNYIRYTGAGIETVESELSRIFPKSRINTIDSKKHLNTKDADIFVATSVITKEEGLNFDLIGIIGIDNSLNRIDFRSSEKTFALLSSLLRLTEKKIIIQSSLPNHICFQALVKKDLSLFYEEELRIRKQLNFPPFKHIILIKLRGRQEEKVKQASQDLFKKLNTVHKLKVFRTVSLNPALPSKLRSKFYWQLLLVSSNVKKACKSLKIYLKDFSHSGIIVTVDVDPL
jgi:primosomal protein N' (replication factor Y)